MQISDLEPMQCSDGQRCFVVKGRSSGRRACAPTGTGVVVARIVATTVRRSRRTISSRLRAYSSSGTRLRPHAPRIRSCRPKWKCATSHGVEPSQPCSRPRRSGGSAVLRNAVHVGDSSQRGRAGRRRPGVTGRARCDKSRLSRRSTERRATQRLG